MDAISNRMISYFSGNFQCFVYVGNYIPPDDKKPRSKKEPNCVNSTIKLSDLISTDDSTN